MKILEEKDIDEINLLPGDSVSLSYEDEKGERELLNHVVDFTQKINKVLVVKVKNILGLKNGVGGFFGEKEVKK